MSRFRVASRLSYREEGEKCPKCLDGWVDFMEIDSNKGLLGCYKCGCVFVRKGVRTEEISGKKDQLERQAKEEFVVVDGVPQENPLRCDVCDFVAKSIQGLKVHRVSHK